MSTAARELSERSRDSLAWLSDRSNLPRVQVLAVVTVAAVVAAVAWLMEHRPYDSWAAVVVAIGLVGISLPMLQKAASLETDTRIARLLYWAFGLKILSAIARYVVAFGVYDGQADAKAYSESGAELARQFQQLDFTVDLGRAVQGTGFIEIVTGVVYALTGATTLGGFFVFSVLSFWGVYLFHRAFVRACPEGDHRRYALLVLLIPSLLFWPSSIGKEAWMSLWLGVVAYGCARLLTHARGALPILAVGFLALGMVRPHVAALLGFATFLAYLVKRPPTGQKLTGPVRKLVVIVLLGAGLVYAVGQLEDFFGVDDFDQEAVETTLAEVTQQTGQGGSQFRVGDTTDLSPSRFPEALVGVMFRPFPWQVDSPQSLIAAAEAAFLALLFLTGWRRIIGSLRSVLRTPYVVMCCTYTVLFVYGFSAFSNAGILVRQRVQVLPFILVLVCLPAFRAREEGGWRALLGTHPR